MSAAVISLPTTICSSDNRDGSCGLSVGDDTDDASLAFFRLPWDHVICRRILPLLGLHQVFLLRRVCRDFKELVDNYYFPHLLELDITRFAATFSPTAFVVATRSAESLRRLTLRGAKHWITDYLLIPVICANERLEELDLTGCSTLSNAAAQAIAVKCRSLVDLYLRDCVWLSAAAVTNVALTCVSLRRVDLSGCWNVNDDAVAMLAQCCPSVVFLNLSRIYGLTDRSVKVIACRLARLAHLSIQGCWRVTDEGLLVLARYATSLQGLQVRDCRSVSERSLAVLRNHKVIVDVPPPRSAILYPTN